VRGKGFQFVTCHAWTLPPATHRCSAVPATRAGVPTLPGRAELLLLV